MGGATYTMSLRVEVEYMTHRGKVRSNNEDALLIMSDVIQKEEMADLQRVVFEGNSFVFAVADGMGGHKAGEVASRLALDYLALNWLSIESADSIDRCIQEMNLQIVKEALMNLSMSNMGTTVAGILICGSTVWVFNVGDSRVYGVHEDELRQISKDQSLLQALIDEGTITVAQARQHPLRGVLLQCLGGGLEERKVQTIIKQFPLDEYDTFLICSDGLTDALTDEEISDCLFYSKKSMLGCLFEKYMKAGATDNMSAVLVRVREKVAKGSLA
ncbi:MAG TPA: hypothetical protein DCR68_00120 [Coprothermobacter sp.]|nr:hypothetical protein [Coprothermobacter sp.]